MFIFSNVYFHIYFSISESRHTLVIISKSYVNCPATRSNYHFWNKCCCPHLSINITTIHITILCQQSIFTFQSFNFFLLQNPMLLVTLFQTQARVGFCPHGAAGMLGKGEKRPQELKLVRLMRARGRGGGGGVQAEDQRNDGFCRGWLLCFSTRSTLSSCQSKFRSLPNWLKLPKFQSIENAMTGLIKSWKWVETQCQDWSNCENY